MILNYLDLPVIPEEFIDEVKRIISTKQDELSKFAGSSYPFYKFYPIDGILEEWLLTNLPIRKSDCFHIHVMNNELPPHKDYNTSRYKLNYIFYTGGECVTTRFYDDSMCLLESHILLPKFWHHFDGQVYHGVTKINVGFNRVAITLGTDLPDSTFKNYLNSGRST